MKKTGLFFLLFTICSLCIAQDGYDLDFDVSTTPSDCQASGTISFDNITGADAPNITSKTYNINDGNGNVASSTPLFVNLKKGNYEVTLLAIINGNPVTRKKNVTIGGNYVVPAASKVVGAVSDPLGTRPTLICDNSGRVQLLITGGIFPYKVETYSGSSLINTDIFPTNQHSGTVASQPDYKDYYNIDGLGEGTYTFRISDGCGYTLPEITENITKVTTDFNCADIIMNKDNDDNNATIIQFDFNLAASSPDIKYYEEHLNGKAVWWEYQIAYDGGAFSGWHAVPPDGMVYDTVQTATKYCDIWGKEYNFNVRIKDCGSTSCKQKITIEKPSALVTLLQDINTADDNGCTIITDTVYSVEVYFSANYYVTYPIRVKIENQTLGTVLHDGLYHSLQNIKWGEQLKVEYYGSDIHVYVTDAMGCEIVDEVKKLEKEDFEIPRLTWNYYSTAYSKACDENRYDRLTIFPTGDQLLARGTVVELIESPDGNFFNYKAEYDISTGKWAVTKDNAPLRDDKVYFSSSLLPHIMLETDSLPEGTYKWQVTDDCGFDSIYTLNATFAASTYKISEELSFTSKKNCQGMMYYPKGQVVEIPRATGIPKDLTTEFRVISGEAGGFKINEGSITGRTNTDSLLITKPGTYEIQMYHDTQFKCLSDTFTIVYNFLNVGLKDAAGYACLDDSGGSGTLGNIKITVDSLTGVAPYQFDLYDDENGNGNFVSSNYTGIFKDVGHVGDIYSVRVTDKCGASFTQNIPIQGIKLNDSNIFGTKQVCQGSPAYLYGISIGIGNMVTYSWKGPGGFTATGREINTPPINTVSRFYLTMTGLECIIKDTVDVYPVLAIQVQVQDSICAGEDYNGTQYKPLITNHLPVGVHTFQETLTAVVGGCDSIVTFNLTINPVYHHTDSKTICDVELPYAYGDTIFKAGTATNTYKVRFKTSCNCDSIVMLDLTVNNTYDLYDNKTLCSSELPYVYGDTIFQTGTTSGVYTLRRKTIHGCDSIVNLTLTVNESYQFTDNRIICDSELPFTYADTIFNKGTTTGTYILSRKRKITNCDSITTINLTVNSTYETLLNENIYLGESYHKNGFNIPVQLTAKSIVQSLHLQSQRNCDSLVVLNLNVLCRENITLYTDSICLNEPYTLYGFSIPGQSVTGWADHQQIHYDKNNCDSIIKLSLFVSPLSQTVLYDDVQQYEAYDANDFVLPVQQDTGVFVFERLGLNSYGCDSLTTLHLRVYEGIMPAKLVTPNGDGVNDYWEIKNIEYFDIEYIYIYDRFGKLLKEYKESFTPWDGTYAGRKVPSTDYWYIIRLKNGREYVGHFTLIN